MSQKKVKLIRKLLDVKLGNKEYREKFYQRYTTEQETGSYKYVIGEDGEVKMEQYIDLQVISSEERRRYQAVKKLYKNTDHELHSDLLRDLKNLNKAE